LKLKKPKKIAEELRNVN